MSKTLYWIQGGSCGGDTWSLMNADTPDPIELFDAFDIEVLWHQALSTTSAADMTALNRRIRCIDYEDFVALVARHQRCVTWA